MLGSKLLRWTTIGYVEYEPYCQKVLKQRIADGILDAAPIFGDIRKFISEGYADAYQGMVDVVTAGFPCQPFSVAGKRQGENDERNLWPETIEVIRRVRPRFAFLENVSALLAHKYVRRIFGDLAESGYDCRWKIISAAEVGAPHKRDRLWIYCYSDENRKSVCTINAKASELSENVANSDGNRCEGFEQLSKHSEKTERRETSSFGSTGKLFNGIDWEKRASESCFLGRDYGMAHRLDRLRAIGNGQVPTVVRTAWQRLTPNERS